MLFTDLLEGRHKKIIVIGVGEWCWCSEPDKRLGAIVLSIFRRFHQTTKGLTVENLDQHYKFTGLVQEQSTDVITVEPLGSSSA